jgi:arylsulfatase A-like enzyme
MVALGASFGLADAVAVASASILGFRVGLTLALWAYTLPLFLVGSLCLGLLVGGVRHMVSRVGLTLGLRVEGATASEMVLAVGPAGGALFGLVYLTAHYFSSTFRNHELASVVVAALVIGYSTGALLGWHATVRGFGWLRRRVGGADTGLAVWTVSVAVPLGVFIAVLVANREGIRTVGYAMMLVPAVGLGAGLASFVGLSRLASSRLRMLARSVWGLAGLSAVLAAVLGGIRPDLPDYALDARLWSARLLRVAQLVTDFDRDGHSSLFGGGDCAPFDAAVSPSQPEIADDGIDNNCRRGDLVSTVVQRSPEWAELPGAYLAPRNLLLVTVEALRHDATSLAGVGEDTTPRMAALAKRGVVFTRFYAAAPHTREALCAIFTTRIPSDIPFEEVGGLAMLAQENPWLPEILKEAGFRTTAILTDFEYFATDESIGFERGFDEYDTSARVVRIGGHLWGFPAEEMIGKAIDVFDAHPEGRLMVWLHLVEPHAKYQQYPGAPVFGTSNHDLYLSEVWGVDRQIGRLVDHLEARGRLDSTVIMVVGDHGEAFGVQGREFHGTALDQPQTHIASLLFAPGVPPGVISFPASQQDIGSTLLNLLDVRVDFQRLSGRNLTPALFGGIVDLPPIVIGLYSNSRAFGPELQIAVIDGSYKLLATRGRRRMLFFDLVADPDERTPLDPRSAPRFDFIEEVMDYQMDRWARRAGSK